MAAERQSIDQVDAELRRVAEAADGLVRAAQEMRGALDGLSESVRAAVRATATPAVPLQPAAPEAAVTTGSAPQPAEVAAGEPEGARIVALNMVLDGKPRDEVAAHLRAEFGPFDSDALLDDVYARVD